MATGCCRGAAWGRGAAAGVAVRPGPRERDLGRLTQQRTQHQRVSELVEDQHHEQHQRAEGCGQRPAGERGGQHQGAEQHEPGAHAQRAEAQLGSARPGGGERVHA